MNINIKKEDGNTIISLDSRLDSSTAGEFDEALQREIGSVEGSLIVDFKNVDFISSIGLRVLVSAYKQLNGKELVIKNANSSVVEILKLSGLLSLFKLQ